MLLKPTAFQIIDYKSIQDSGICTLSGDHITVLAGQNEAGKTSVLRALYDFNQEIGKPSTTKDFVPDQNPEANPLVKFLFKLDLQKLVSNLAKNNELLPEEVMVELTKKSDIWITRQLLDGALFLEDRLETIWPADAEIDEKAEEDDEEVEEDDDDDADESDTENEQLPLSSDDDQTSKNYVISLHEFKVSLWENWPVFVYFDSFDDLLPREIGIDLVSSQAAGQPVKWKNPELPQSVSDFITLSEINLQRIRQLAKANDEKQLRNYLNGKSATITGDFLGYWKQKIGGDQTVTLRAEHSRKSNQLFLNFFAFDGKILQYPDQRSKGFSWFLSFYLRLAASVTDEDRNSQVILIDEPGSFLHQKAQQDILDILEKRIAIKDLVILSSHSPYMMPSTKMHRVRVVAKNIEGLTFIADRLTDERIQRDERGDALSPIMAAIGLDIGWGSHVMHQENFVVEGITDFYYLHAWSKLLEKPIFSNRGIIAAKGCSNVPNLISLCLAWSRKFAVLLDRDSAGEAAKKELIEKMDISKDVIVQPHDAACIEDIFSPQDFKALLAHVSDRYKLDAGQIPSKAIARHSIDKVLLARTFAELVVNKTITQDTLTQKTKESALSLFESLETAIGKNAVFAVNK